MPDKSKTRNENCKGYASLKAARAPDARFASGFTFYHLSKHKTVLYRFMQ